MLFLGFGVRADAAEPPASSRQLEGQRVVGVEFDPPDQPLTKQELSNLVPVKPGQPFKAAELRTTIKNLYATGRYADIQAAGRRRPGGLTLVIRTKQQWFIGRVDARGLKRDPSDGQLAESAHLELGRPLNDDDIDNATKRVTDLLRRNGLYDAQVEASLSRDPEHQLVNIRFLVDRGKRAKFAKPTVTGNPGMDPDRIVAATKWHNWLLGWKKVTEPRVEGGLQKIRKKYADKDRLTARVNLEGMDYDPATRKVTPRLNVETGPKVELHTEGAKVSKKDLKRYVPVFQEMTVDRDLLVEGARNLRDYFQMKGYFGVKVDFKQEQPKPDHLDIVYTIDLGLRRKVVDVIVQGNRYFDRDTIRERMMIQPNGFLRLRHGRYSEAAVKRDEGNIKALYQGNGFRDVKVTTRTLDNYKGKPHAMAVVVTIDEGPQYKVSSFEVAGLNQDVPAQQIVPVMASMKGQPFSETNVALDRRYISEAYQAQGYNDVRFDWEMRPGPSPNTVDVRYRVNPGEKREVRNVVVTGADFTRMRLIDPAMRLAPGEPLSTQQMFQTQRDLYELGIFEKVDAAVQNPEGDAPLKNVLYEIAEGHRYNVAVGVGAEVGRIGGNTTDYSAPAGQTGFSPRVNLEVSRLNLWGLGHSLNFKSRYSSLQKRFLLNYSAPRYRNVEGRNLSFTGVFDDSRDVRTFSAKRWETSAQLSQRLSKATNALFRLSWRRVTVDPNTLKISPLLIPTQSQAVRVGMISMNLINDRRDDPADSHRGIYTSLDVGISERWLASTQNFGKILVRNSTYHPFGRGEKIVVARSLQVGWLAPFALARGLSTADAIPLPERFFGGGSTSHRGFPDNQAGPRDPQTGFPIGGNTLLFHQTELRFPLIGDNINGVLFHDMGNIYSRPGKVSFRTSQHSLTDFDYMVHAVGFGVRYRTPVGPVRLDLAYSLNPPRFFGFNNADRQKVILGQATPGRQQVKHFQFFFSIGQTF